jgi:hypothetical protein
MCTHLRSTPATLDRRLAKNYATLTLHEPAIDECLSLPPYSECDDGALVSK